MSGVVARMPAREGEELFREFHGMEPSRSSLERVTSVLGERWEAHREEWEDALRSQETIPSEAAIMAVSLDGVLVPMPGEMSEKKKQDKDKQASGPTGYKEVGCGTVSLYDAEGERLSTVRYGRMPEYKKSTLTTQLTGEVESILAARPDLRLVAVADGAKENWRFLEGTWPEAVPLVDIFHANEHLKKALDAYYGKNSKKSRREFEKLRIVLKEEVGGVETVIRALAYRRDKAKSRTRKETIETEMGYFRRNRERMRYAEALADNLPIGSGVMEASCKTLATQRMKCSGMRWTKEGNGQAVLTLRSLQQSNRWHSGWGLMASSFRTPVIRIYRRNERVLKAVA